MKRKFVQIAALCLAAALMAGLTGETASAAPANSSDRVIRVGLHYGTGAMEGINLENDVGSGYRFGYYDSANQFVPLGSTWQERISVVETVNVYYGKYNDYTSYHTAAVSSIAVGEYHLQLPGSYATFDEAQAAASAYGGGFPAYIGGVFCARIGNYTTRDRALSAQSALAAQGVETTLAGTSAYGLSVVVTGTNTMVFQYDDLGSGAGLGVEPIAAGGEKAVTWSKKFRYYGGFRFERINGGKMTVVNMIHLEDYVKGVISTEMSNSWPLEALKAQAVAARSYALALGTKHGVHHFDICFDTDCQAYSGLNLAGANTDAAVDQTAGQVALYNGTPIQAFFYASSGGASETPANVWGGSQSYPYLMGKADPYEAGAPIPNYSWTRTFSADTLASKLRAIGYNVNGTIVSVAITAWTDSGNPRLVSFTDSAGKSYPVSTYNVIQKMLYLPSYRYGLAGGGGTSQPAPTAPSTPASPSTGGVTVNGSAAVNGTSGLYAIDGNGNLSILGNDVYVITDSGTTLLSQDQGQTGNSDQDPGQNQAGNSGGEWNNSATAVNGSFTFAGKGSGHNVGMSQWGAYAMANQGYTYQQILQFYYTGITVGYM